ncbi:TRAP transporter small permease subunit [Alcaligenaceae bacterium CGII-47]|nr:TRAP transporter small permease subunit [Alcaligenaceae bacterium CGII-47]
MTDWATAFERRLYSIENFVCSASLLVMLVTVTVGVCIRFFDLPIPNVAEWAIVAMSPLTFVGAAMCSRMKMHISVDFIEQARSKLLKWTAHFIVATLMLGFSVIYAWLGWSLFEDAMRSGENLLDMGTPLYVPIFFFFAGMVAMGIHGLLDLARCVRSGWPLISINEEAL